MWCYPATKTDLRRVEEHVWLPGTASVDGMLGGLFSHVGERRYLTTTGWRDARSHERYVHDRVPVLRAAAGETAWLSERLNQHRGYLRAVAYQMLGSLTEADRVEGDQAPRAE